MKRVAVIAGDGIGPEVVSVAWRVLEQLSVDLELEAHDAGWSAFERVGNALPEETLAAARASDAIIFGAVSSPSGAVDGYRSPILTLRRELDLYANLRPIRSSPLADSRDDIDLLIVRENTEGLYSGRERLEDDGLRAVAERVITSTASRRIAERAFREARRRATVRRRPGRVTIVHKANVLRLSDGLFRQAALDVAGEYADVEVEEQLVDSMAYHLFRQPERYDVLVTPNLYGDILSDAAAALVGGLGLVASANIGDASLLVEPVHGSAPDIAGRHQANPIATLNAAALLLDHFEETAAAVRLRLAIDDCLRAGPRTPDLGGTATTEDVATAILGALR